MINIIAAVAKNKAIGYNNKLLYWLPNDLQRFKRLTTGHTVIMGRRTYESLPHGALPMRRNIVLSRQHLTIPNCEVFCSLDEAISHCSEEEEVYILGGASVYGEAMHIADRLCLTEVNDFPENADAFFPDYSEWKPVWKESHEKDERHKYGYTFIDYIRK